MQRSVLIRVTTDSGSAVVPPRPPLWVAADNPWRNIGPPYCLTISGMRRDSAGRDAVTTGLAGGLRMLRTGPPRKSLLHKLGYRRGRSSTRSSSGGPDSFNGRAAVGRQLVYRQPRCLLTSGAPPISRA